MGTSAAPAVSSSNMGMKFAVLALSTAVLLLGVPATCSDKKPLTFQSTIVADFEDTKAAKAGFHTHQFGSTAFKSSNGRNLTLTCGDFKDADEAKRFLEWSAQKAFKVLRQYTKRDRSGKPIEYRVGLIPEWDHSSVEVMSAIGSTARWIVARNREDALELEKYYRRSLLPRP